MNKKIIKILCLLLGIALTGCEKKTPSITVNYSNFGGHLGDQIYLFSYEEGKNIDSIEIKKESGTVVFNAVPSKKEMFYSVTLKNMRPNESNFYAGLNDIEVSVNLTKGDYEEMLSLTVQKGGSVEQNQYSKYLKGMNALLETEKNLLRQWDSLKAKGVLKTSPYRETLEEQFIANSEDITNYNHSYIQENQNATSLYLLNTSIKWSYDMHQLQDICKSYDSAKYASSSMYSNLTDRINLLRKLEKGAVAPDFTIPDVNGKDVSLSSFRGKYVLLDFWASWCGPCRAENPHVVEAYKKFNDKGFEILGVSYDYPGMRENWLKAIEEDKLTWTHVSNVKGWNDPTAKLYDIKGIPSPFLLDPEGKIIAKHDEIRGDGLTNKLDSIFNK